MATYFDTNEIVQMLMDHEHATPLDINKEALEVFKNQCECIDSVINSHSNNEPVELDFDIDDEKDIVVKITFTGKPSASTAAFRTLRMTSLSDEIASIGNNKYVMIFLLGGFINY